MKKKEALYVSWEESEPSDTDEEQNETANLRTVNNNICFKAHEDEVISDSEEPFTLDELKDAYIEFEKDLKKLDKRYSSLKKSMHTITLKLMSCSK